MPVPIVSVDTPYPLGCHLDHNPDPRNHPLELGILSAKPAKTINWQSTLTLNQGQIPGCTGWAQATYLASQPIPEENISNSIGLKIYKEAQKRDPWSNHPHDGSTITAAMQASMYLYPHVYDSYKFVTTLNQLLLAHTYIGPSIAGTEWTNQMFNVDPVTHFIKVDLASGVVGGHSYMICGQNIEKRFFIIHNQWDNSWGLHGKSFISFDDFELLLSRSGNQVIVPMGKQKVVIS